MESINRIALLEAWIRWCLNNCDDSPEWNFGIEATNKIQALLRGENVQPPIYEQKERAKP